MKIGPKIDLEPTLGSKISLLEAFGAVQKYNEFLVPFFRPKNRENWSKKRPMGANGEQILRQWCRSVGSGPQGGHARDQKLGTRNKELG